MIEEDTDYASITIKVVAEKPCESLLSRDTHKEGTDSLIAERVEYQPPKPAPQFLHQHQVDFEARRSETVHSEKATDYHENLCNAGAPDKNLENAGIGTAGVFVRGDATCP